jgi:hypothetical protein
MLIKIKGRNRMGKSRSETEANLHKEWGSASLTHEEIDKCRFIEKKTGAGWVDKELIKNVGRIK